MVSECYSSPLQCASKEQSQRLIWIARLSGMCDSVNGSRTARFLLLGTSLALGLIRLPSACPDAGTGTSRIRPLRVPTDAMVERTLAALHEVRRSNAVVIFVMDEDKGPSCSVLIQARPVMN